MTGLVVNVNSIQNLDTLRLYLIVLYQLVTNLKQNKMSIVEQMIQIVEENAVDNKAVIPDVESWAIAWREEADKLQPNDWSQIWSEWIKKDSKFRAIDLLDFLFENYEPPTKKA
jgi:hypothetical protein